MATRPGKAKSILIQIQPMLRLNLDRGINPPIKKEIQIQPMLRLNVSQSFSLKDLSLYSNTTNVKVKLGCTLMFLIS